MFPKKGPFYDQHWFWCFGYPCTSHFWEAVKQPFFFFKPRVLLNELRTDRESCDRGTEEDRVNCPFYFKIGACRNGHWGWVWLESSWSWLVVAYLSHHFKVCCPHRKSASFPYVSCWYLHVSWPRLAFWANQPTSQQSSHWFLDKERNHSGWGTTFNISLVNMLRFSSMCQTL